MWLPAPLFDKSLLVCAFCLLAVSALSADTTTLNAETEDAQVRSLLQEAIDSSDYQSDLPFAESTPRERRSSWEPIGSGPLAVLMSAFAWILIFVVVVLIILAVVLAIAKPSLGQVDTAQAVTHKKSVAGRVSNLNAEERVDFLGRAETLAGQGHYREAVHMLLLGAIDHLARASRIQCRSSETSREVLRAYQAEPERRSALQRLVETVERSVFGGHSLSRQDFDACRACLQTLCSEAGP